MLHWQSQLDVTALCASSGFEKSAMDSVLAKLGSFGAVGFDLGRAAWFHRVLPIDLERALAHLERQQPRLRAAGKLLAEGAVSIFEQNEALIRGEVRSADVVHRVRIEAGEGRCTCPWFVKHQNERGACKHVLALELASNSQHSKSLEP